jgi:tetratricopeptide (TPR) repeat protein
MAGDVGRVRSAVDRLARVGRDSPKLRIALARMLAREGSLSYAKLEYEIALDLHPTKAAWLGLANLHQRTEQWQEAALAYEEALKFDPELEQAWYNLGLVRMKLDQPELAREAFAHALELKPDRKINQVMLERAEATADD